MFENRTSFAKGCHLDSKYSLTRRWLMNRCLMSNKNE